MFNRLNQIALVAVLGFATFAPGIGVSSALSFPVMPPANAVDIQVSEVIPVQHMHDRRMNRRMDWQARRDGRRCRSRFGDCRHFHRGYYYETPWWTLPLIIGDTIARQNDGRGSHVQWCLSRYRSYNPRTDTWLGTSGRRYQCNSPY
jgi:BA14K-like protein